MKSLGILGEQLRNIGIRAEFKDWTGKIPIRYWVYTYIELDNNFETGCKSGVLILDGFTRGDISQLEEEKELIIEKFQDYRTVVEGTAVYLGSASGQTVDTYDPELKRIQITIDFKEWRY